MLQHFSEAVGMTLKIKQQSLIGISHMWVPRASWVPLIRAEGGKKQLDNTPVVGQSSAALVFKPSPQLSPQ